MYSFNWKWYILPICFYLTQISFTSHLVQLLFSRLSMMLFHSEESPSGWKITVLISSWNFHPIYLISCSVMERWLMKHYYLLILFYKWLLRRWNCLRKGKYISHILPYQLRACIRCTRLAVCIIKAQKVLNRSLLLKPYLWIHLIFPFSIWYLLWSISLICFFIINTWSSMIQLYILKLFVQRHTMNSVLDWLCFIF